MPSVANVIAHHRKQILDEWTEGSRHAAGARGLNAPQLSNLMPRYLDALGQPGGPERLNQLVERHIASRLREGFRVEEAIDEFSLLHRCVIAALWAEAGGEGRPDSAAVSQFLEQISTVTGIVAETYTQHLQNDAQSEKGYVRRLQNIASTALRSEKPEEALHGRLKEVCELMMEAMEAQSAAMLLREVGTGELVMVASAGSADEPLLHYSTERDASSFVAQIAAKDGEPSELLDVRTTPLVVSDALRSSGIHSLLGVRLPSHGDLLGVLYVGLSAQREFTPRELRRIEVLGEWLGLHLDNAGMNLRLRRTIATLEDERALRDRFVAVLAHDLRGPLSAARLHAQRMDLSGEPRGTLSGAPQMVIRDIDRADRMIRDLLDAHRIRAGQPLALSLAECDLTEIARTVVDEMRAAHGERFVLRAPDAVRGVWSADDLRRALWNLTTNAVKYGAKGRPVTVTVRATETGAEVSVHNEGPTIPKEELTVLFQPFTQLRVRTTNGRHGWGLGLTLVRGCAEAHGGTVAVRSDPGEGTTFTMTLPRDARSVQPAA